MLDMLFYKAIRTVEEYRENRKPSEDLMDASYSDWALDEILDRLCEEVANNPMLLNCEGAFTPKDVVDLFYLEMEYLEDTADTPRQQMIFSIAKREAGNVLDLM